MSVTRTAEELKVPEVWIGSRRYASKKARQEAVQAILGRYGLGQDVDQEDDDLLLRDLLDMHPDAADKVGPGVDRFRVIATPRGHHKGPEAVLVDGSKVAFSYMKCLDAPTHRQRVLAAMRTEIQPQVNTYFESRKAAHTLVSDESGQDLAPADVHVSYFQGPRFHDIALEFVQAAGGFDAIDLTAETARGLALFTDRALAERWHDHHQEHAVLGLLSAKENLRRPRA
ncbi:DCL family protein [Streptomyces aureoverticillatus]|uniref:DCL family protein n=1 Tax=Streptomyces aureoverticillatus TaxID=66871 RepID=UPI001EF8A463|nr:DCL family protein [Streptomyces aureoverticillatus]